MSDWRRKAAEGKLEVPSSGTRQNMAKSSGVPRNFVRGGGVQQIQLRTERKGIWGR